MFKSNPLRSTAAYVVIVVLSTGLAAAAPGAGHPDDPPCPNCTFVPPPVNSR
jgi:hypothetical protein